MRFPEVLVQAAQRHDAPQALLRHPHQLRHHLVGAAQVEQHHVGEVEHRRFPLGRASTDSIRPRTATPWAG
jgi:hypothetical protein